jgi:hypothetical protein
MKATLIGVERINVGEDTNRHYHVSVALNGGEWTVGAEYEIMTKEEAKRLRAWENVATDGYIAATDISEGKERRTDRFIKAFNKKCGG